MTIIDPTDLPVTIQSHELVDVFVFGANAKAVRVAPCLAKTGDDAPTDEQVGEARLILIGAISRWAEAGAGALQSQTVGPFGVTADTRQRTGYHLWPSEIADLQAICKGDEDTPSGAFSIDTAPGMGSAHTPWCAAILGALYCDCGTDIAGEPIYGLGDEV